MGIPPQYIPIKLLPDDPTKLTPKGLQEQLRNIGLTCDETDEAKLEEHIKDVRDDLPRGKAEILGVFGPPENLRKGKGGSDYEKISNGHWIPDGSFGYQTELFTIQVSDHFEWLLENQVGFTGVKEEPDMYEGRESTVDIIKDHFVKVAVCASAAIIDGLDEEASEAVFENAIAPVDDENTANYDSGWLHRVLYLVFKYDPDHERVDGLGVLTVDWRLTIKDYKEKKGDLEKSWTLTVKARSVLYSTVCAMCRDYCAVASFFQTEKYFELGLEVPKVRQISIFHELPAACERSFLSGVPLVTRSQYIEVLVLHSPEFEQIGCIDNDDSDSEVAWTKCLSTGLAFPKDLEFYPSAKFEASKVVTKKLKSMELSACLSNSSTKSSTETITMTVPAHKKTFIYQGTVDVSVLRFDPRVGSCNGGSEGDSRSLACSGAGCGCGFKFMGEGKLLTNTVVSSSTSLM